MISKQAVKKFLGRQLEDFDWIKGLSDAELDDLLNEMEPRPRFHTKPFRHQKACFIIGTAMSEFLYFLEVGLGKTKIVQDLLEYERLCGQSPRALVLVPNITNIESWADQCREHVPGLRCVPMVGDSRERWEALDGDGDIFVLNYAGLVAMATELTKLPGRKKRKRQVVPQRVEKLKQFFDCVIADECQALKAWNSLTFKVVKQLAHQARLRYALTGTPLGRDPMDLWAQFYCIDKGETLGATLGIYRAAFFDTKINHWGGREYSLKKNRADILHEVMKNRSIRYRVDESDLPGKTYNVIKVGLPDESEAYYQEVVREVIAARGDFKEMDNAFIKMRQLASGFMTFRDEEEDDRVKIRFDHIPKMEAMTELVRELPHDSKMIIFHEFTYSGQMLCDMLNEEKVKHVWLYGGTKDKKAVLRKFLDDSDTKILVCNSKSGGTGLNLQVANYVCFYESPVSPMVRTQAEGRCYRTGQDKKVLFYDIVARDSIEEKILTFLQEGKDLFRALVDGEEEL